MAKIGSMELIVILIVAMLAIGPERLPKAARTLGKAVGSFKKYMNDATSDLRCLLYTSPRPRDSYGARMRAWAC